MTPPLRELPLLPESDELVELVPETLSMTFCRTHSPKMQLLSVRPPLPKTDKITDCLNEQDAVPSEEGEAHETDTVPVNILIVLVKFDTGTPPQNVAPARHVHLRLLQFQSEVPASELIS